MVSAMSPTMLFHLFAVTLLARCTVSVLVSDLKPDVNCLALMAQKAEERSKDPTILDKITITNEIDYKKATSIYDFTVKDTYLNDVKLGEFCKGMPTLIVNFGSQCGYSPINYAHLSELQKEYGDKIRILLFANNQFYDKSLMPESDGDEMLCQFKIRRVDPGHVFAKVDVNGDNAIPLYKYLEDQIKGEKGPDVEWYYAKFLVDKNGKPFKRYPPAVEPRDIVNDIKSLL